MLEILKRILSNISKNLYGKNYTRGNEQSRIYSCLVFSFSFVLFLRRLMPGITPVVC